LPTFARQIKFKFEEVGGPSVWFVFGFGPPSGIWMSINFGLIWACYRPQVKDEGATCLTGPDTKSCNQSIIRYSDCKCGHTASQI